MIKMLLLILLTTFYTSIQAQYYYKDIVVLDQNQKQWQAFKTNDVKSIKLLSYEADNTLTEGFSAEQVVQVNNNRLLTSSRSIQNGSSEMTSQYNLAGRLIYSRDTSEDYSSVTRYEYNTEGKPVSISNMSSSAGQFSMNEVHLWMYDEKGFPLKMLRIRNEKDTTTFTFVLDEKGNVLEEHGTRLAGPEPTIYYYYDDQNRLTDIVRYSMKARRLLPTHVFGYDANGRLAAMLLVPEGTTDYQRWYYDYNDRGLKTRERLYDKQQRMVGKVEYNYTF